MTDSQSLYTIKVPSHFLMVESSNIPLLRVCVEILPLSEDAPQGYSSRPSERDFPMVMGVAE